METIDGYQRAALSLRQLPAEEQAWILEQLDEHERTRLGEVLQALQNGALPVKNGAKTGFEPAPGTDSESYVSIIEGAAGNVLAAVLSEQPDWITALVLAHSEKSGAVQRFVNRFGSDQMERLRPLMKQARDKIKPKVRELVLRGIADKVQQRVAQQAEAADFESVLGQVANQN